MERNGGVGAKTWWEGRAQMREDTRQRAAGRGGGGGGAGGARRRSRRRRRRRGGGVTNDARPKKNSKFPIGMFREFLFREYCSET